MNQEEAIKQFVEREYQRLTSEDFSLSDLKAARNTYFRGKGRKVSSPTNKEVVNALFSLLKRRGVTPDQISDYVNSLPIFRIAGEALQQELLDSLRSTNRESALKPEDIEMIKQVGAYEALKQVVVKDKEQQLQDIDEKIKQRNQEYNNLPSILDQEIFPEPDFNPQVEDVKPWWERFYLKSDPFLRKDGLSSISEDLYEEVLVKTKPFEETLSHLNKNSKYLFHSGFLLAGDYGYGKTTFIDYISFHLIYRGSLPIRITCSKPYPDSSGFAHSFYTKLRNELKKEWDNISNQVNFSTSELEVEDEIIELARNILGRRNGIVVFLDDYHKHRTQFTYIYEFLGTLQILKDNLTREGLDVGFVVSGTSEWKAELARNGQMEGFLDKTPIEMPLLTPESVCEVFNQRIKAYCFETSPRRIKLDFVKHIFREAQGQTGYRDYLNRIIQELTNNNSSVIDTPIEIAQDTLDKVQNELERDPALKSSFKKLVYESKFQKFTNEQVSKCLELLIQTSTNDGVSENDKLFAENKFYFQRLKEVDLIQKSKGTGTSNNPVLRWTLRTRLQAAVDNIYAQYQYGLNDYLLKIYGWKSGTSQLAIKTEQSPSQLLEVIRFFDKSNLKLKETTIQHVQLALQNFDAVQISNPTGKQEPDRIARAHNSFEQLSAAFFEIDGSNSFFAAAGVSHFDQKWHLHWLTDNEGILELLKRFADYSVDKSTIKYITAIKQFQDVFPLLAEHLLRIAQDVCAGKYEELLTRSIHHTEDEIKLFDSVLSGYYSHLSSDHMNYVKSVTDYFELKIRAFLYATTTLLFGENYVNQIPEQQRSYAHRSISTKQNYTTYSNFYDGLTRPDFKKIFLDGNPIKENVVAQLQTVWKTSDWEKFFDTFAEQNIATAHQQTAAFSHLERPNYLRYCQLAEEFTTALNMFASGLLNNKAFLIKDENHVNPTAPEAYKFKYFYKRTGRIKDDIEIEPRVYRDTPDFLRKDIYASHELSTSTYMRVLDLVIQKIQNSAHSCITEDILDIEMINSSYNVSYCEFINSLVFARGVDKRLHLTPWFGSSIIIKLQDAL